MQYFAQDEATRLDPTLTVYQTLAGDAPMHMVPSIRNILGGFLFSGDDVDKPVRVLSGGERTRLAVARMLLRPSNTLLLDEPTNHLDLDSKDVLLEALEDFGGTLIFVSHDRYFVDKLATKVINIGGGDALLYPGNYEEFLWSRKQQERRGARVPRVPQGAQGPGVRRKLDQRDRACERGAEDRGGGCSQRSRSGQSKCQGAPEQSATCRQVRLRRPDGSHRQAQRSPAARRSPSYDERKRQEAEARKASKALDARRKRIDDLEARIADREQAIKRHRGHDGGARGSTTITKRKTDYRQAPGADVGSRRPDAPVGRAPADRSVIECQTCNHLDRQQPAQRQTFP